MSRKYRPLQCPQCRFLQQRLIQDKFFGNRRLYCQGGGLGVIDRYDHPVKLVGSSGSRCPDFDRVNEGGGK